MVLPDLKRTEKLLWRRRQAASDKSSFRHLSLAADV